MKILVLAIASTVSAPDQLIQPQPMKDGIPQPPKIIEGLPEDVPLKAGEEAPLPGTLLPDPLDLAVGQYIGYCRNQLPALCKEARDAAVEAEKEKGIGWEVPLVIGVILGAVTTGVLVYLVK